LHEALYNWGNALSDQAKTRDGAEADSLYELAARKYEAALGIKPDYHHALNNWGAVLYSQAIAKKGDEADRLFELAGRKYEAALKIKPDKHEALINWGNALLGQAKTKQGAEADSLFELAVEKLLEVESLSRGSGAYNLACLNALRGDEKECRKWLEKSRDFGWLPSREHMEQDTDLDNVRECQWFQDLLASQQ